MWYPSSGSRPVIIAELVSDDLEILDPLGRDFGKHLALEFTHNNHNENLLPYIGAHQNLLGLNIKEVKTFSS